MRTKGTARKLDTSANATASGTRAHYNRTVSRPGSTTGAKKKLKLKPGDAAIREIKTYQKSAENLLPRAPFNRLVREIADDLFPDLRFQDNALAALQSAAESFLVDTFNDSQLCAIHAHRQVVRKEDMMLTRRIRGGDANMFYVEDVLKPRQWVPKAKPKPTRTIVPTVVPQAQVPASPNISPLLAAVHSMQENSPVQVIQTGLSQPTVPAIEV